MSDFMDFKDIKFGVIPSPEDKRDYASSAGIPTDIELPKKFSLRDKVKYIINQKQYGTCTGCAGVAVKNIQENIDNNLPTNGLSPLYIYTMSKQIDGIPDQEGSYPRCTMEVMSKGVLPENDLPYSLLLDSKKLPNITEEQKQKAIPYRIKSYAQIFDNNIINLKQALITQGAVLGTLVVTDAFMFPEQNKYIGDPKGVTYGCHAICICGYDDELTYTFSNGKTEKGFILIQNSWGNWADSGFAWIPYNALNCNTDYGIPFMFEMWTSVDFINSENKNSYWRCQVGAYKNKEFCVRHQQKILNEIGWKTYMVFIDGLWKLQFGCFNIEQNCRNLSRQLTSMGYPNFVTFY